MANLTDSYEDPPEFGSLELSASVVPVSLQGSKRSKATYKKAISDITSPVTYLLTGEVKIHIEWMIHEELRYETVNSPDVDNIIKPLLDAITGPSGLIVDDSQVQTISCHWVDWTSSSQRVNVRIDFVPDEFVRKEGLRFVHFGNKMYMPLPKQMPENLLPTIIFSVQTGFDLYRDMRSKGIDYYSARNILPVQRPFHRSRLEGFELIESSDLMPELPNPRLHADEGR